MALTPSQLDEYFQKYRGRSATQRERQIYLTAPLTQLENDLINSNRNILGRGVREPTVATGTTPVNLPAQQTIPTYNEFLQGAGSPYASRYSDETLNREYDPYYQSLLGSLENERLLAGEDVSRLSKQTTRNVGENYSDRNIYGSGLYQEELGRQIGDINRNYERQYGVGEYTPYSQRKREIEQQRLLAKEQARLNRQNQAFQSYQQSYYPTLSLGT